ncbi:hypothetical protein TNCV_3541341 [Trichonephila clavipes]|nr:hypothetical protein TNCV_3541341 [Trichonephila clavipes]
MILNTKLPNSETDVHSHARTLPPQWLIDPTRFLVLSFRKNKIDNKLIGLTENSTFLLPMGHGDSARWFQMIWEPSSGWFQMNCPDTQQDPKHRFSCTSIVGALFKIDNDCSMDILYSNHAMDVSTEVIHAFAIFDDIFMFCYYHLCTLSYTTTTTLK